MLKLVLCLALVGCALAAEELSWDKIPEAGNSTQCIYRPEIRLLACRGVDRTFVVECPAVLELSAINSTRRFEVFGIARVEGKDVEARLVRYNLYPRRIENNTYEDRRIRIDGERVVDLTLFTAEESGVESGVRVSDVKCYERLVELFRRSTHRQEIRIGEEQVNLFGEILVSDKPATKRWVGWLNPWGFGLGWGWGLGWGLPVWGAAVWGK
jgi:hypothetical protein